MVGRISGEANRKPFHACSGNAFAHFHGGDSWQRSRWNTNSEIFSMVRLKSI
jgi:hypothetical protein